MVILLITLFVCLFLERAFSLCFHHLMASEGLVLQTVVIYFLPLRTGTWE